MHEVIRLQYVIWVKLDITMDHILPQSSRWYPGFPSPNQFRSDIIVHCPGISNSLMSSFLEVIEIIIKNNNIIVASQVPYSALSPNNLALVVEQCFINEKDSHLWSAWNGFFRLVQCWIALEGPDHVELQWSGALCHFPEGIYLASEQMDWESFEQILTGESTQSWLRIHYSPIVCMNYQTRADSEQIQWWGR